MAVAIAAPVAAPTSGAGSDVEIVIPAYNEETDLATRALVTLLKADTTHRWVAAVIAIGGFSGSDPAPTLARFKAMVANGQIHYYIAGGANGPGGGRGSASEIGSWVSANFSSTTIGGQTIYDLTKAAS